MKTSRTLAAAGALALVSTGACLIPSFDDLQGAGSSGAHSGGASADASSTDAGEARANDAAPDSTRATFSCGVDGNRCTVGVHVCCGMNLDPHPACRPIAERGACAATLSCGDNADCPNGLVCCYRDGFGMTPSEAKCETSCSGVGLKLICDPQKPSCPGTQTCAPDTWGYPSCGI